MPRDIATRAIFKVVYEYNLGIDGKPMVYLDLTHIDRKTLDRKLEGILEIYEKFVGDDPRDVPMKIFPGMHYTMGGLWVDFNQDDEYPRHLRGGRVRTTQYPRRESAGREFPAVAASTEGLWPGRMRWRMRSRLQARDGRWRSCDAESSGRRK